MTLKSSSVPFLVLVVVVAMTKHVRAGFSTDCYDNWSYSGRKNEGTESPLSTCQAQQMELSKTNNILLGGKGSAEIVGISAGGSSDGCTSSASCMHACQAMCCITPGCKYATIKREKKTVDYVVYKETERYYYCRMDSTEDLEKSDSQATCYSDPMVSDADCMEIASSSSLFQWDTETFTSLKTLGAFNTCSLSRRLDGDTNITQDIALPSEEEIISAVRAVFEPFADFRAGVEAEQNANNGDICALKDDFHDTIELLTKNATNQTCEAYGESKSSASKTGLSVVVGLLLWGVSLLVM